MQALSINPRSIQSMESIVECGITLTNPLKVENNNNETDKPLKYLDPEVHSGSSSLNDSRHLSRSNSRLAMVAREVGMLRSRVYITIYNRLLFQI